MGKTARILLIILINIIISAATTLTVLWLWERAHPRPETSVFLPALSPAEAPAQTGASLEQLPADEPLPEFLNQDLQISIRTIVGAGDLAVEYVEIINQGQNPADLTAWQLEDEDGHQFTFPALLLNGGGAIKVLSRTGTDTVIELFWQADGHIWQPGETARLVDPSGELITTYTIP